MDRILQKQIKLVSKDFDKLYENTFNKRLKLKEELIQISKRHLVHQEAWVGEWDSSTIDVYRRNFNLKSEYAARYSVESLYADLEKKTNINVENIISEAKAISLEYRNYKNQILTELAIINSTNFDEEKSLFRQIEEFSWGFTPSQIIKSQLPKFTIITDYSQLNKSIKTPPHILINGEIVSLSSLFSAFDNFDKIVKRLIRQLEIQIDFQINDETSIKSEINLYSIIDKFHTAAKLIVNRYNNRDTIIIKDEYDVQDLLNILLSIHYDDIRKEENTPSYAGSSSRSDFLLKREKIIIEVKKTRKGLKDKEVGSQLIIDIAHYKSHPDCKHLICFVYDPDSHIVNPRGLEDDLNKLSQEEFKVEVFIRP